MNLIWINQQTPLVILAGLRTYGLKISDDEKADTATRNDSMKKSTFYCMCHRLYSPPRKILIPWWVGGLLYKSDGGCSSCLSENWNWPMWVWLKLNWPLREISVWSVHFCKFLYAQYYAIPEWANVVTYHPKHPNWDLNLQFTPQSGTTSIPVIFIWEFLK